MRLHGDSCRFCFVILQDESKSGDGLSVSTFDQLAQVNRYHILSAFPCLSSPENNLLPHFLKWFPVIDDYLPAHWICWLPGGRSIMIGCQISRSTMIIWLSRYEPPCGSWRIKMSLLLSGPHKGKSPLPSVMASLPSVRIAINSGTRPCPWVVNANHCPSGLHWAGRFQPPDPPIGWYW